MPQDIGLSEIDFIDLLIEENKNISSSINKSFIDMLDASGIFNIFDYSESLPSESNVEQVKKMHRYSICPEITEFDITESETSGLFLKLTINFTIENYINDTRKDLSVSAIGWGKNRRGVIANSLDKIINQFEYVVAEFEELADSFRIVDIYQGSVIINKGKNRKIKKGDFLYSYDYQTGKKTGNFVIERADQKLSYARILDTKVEPKTEDPLKSYNYIGILSETYVNSFSGNFFSGYLRGTKIIWTRWLYTVNPVFGLNIYDLANVNGSKVVLMTPYAGFRIVRYIRSFSLSSVFTFDKGYLSESELERTPPGWEYYGGTIKVEITKKIMKHLFINLEGGYSGFFSPSYDYYPEITGFVFGGGIGLKF